MITHQKKQRFTAPKLLLSLALLLIIAFVTKGETKRFSAYTYPDPARQDTVNASFPGGEREQGLYLSRVINSNQFFKDSVIHKQGVVNVQFMVDESGELKNFTPVENDIPYLTKLITTGLKEGPVWTPKKIDGKPVPSIQKVLLKVSVDQWDVGHLYFTF